MTPTRRIEPKKPDITVNTRAVTAAAGSATTNEVGSAAKVSPDRAVSVDLSHSAQMRSDATRIDSQRLKALKESVANGTYQVDAQAIANRIVENALGPEALE